MSEYTSIVLKIIMIFILLFGLVAVVGTAYAIDKEFRKTESTKEEVTERSKRPMERPR